MACPLAAERVWTEKAQYHDAEKKYFESLSKLLKESKPETTAATALTAEMFNESPDEWAAAEATSAKSPMKKARKNKNKKETSPTASSLTAASSVPVEATAAAIKVKVKKDKKHMKNVCSSTADVVATAVASISSEDNKDMGFAADDDLSIDNCPFKTVVVESAKVKKQKKRDKKAQSAKESEQQQHTVLVDESAGDDEAVSVQSTGEQKLELDHVKETGGKKEKKSRSKKTVSTVDRSSNQDDAQAGGECTLVSEIAKARQHIKNSLERMDGIAALASTPGRDVLDRISNLEKENTSLRDIVEQLRKASLQSEDRIKQLESRLQSLNLGGSATAAAKATAPAAPAASSKVSDDDDGVDLFGSDSEDEDDAAAQLREQRLAEYAQKKSKKPALIAKSNIILDVKPWDDETDMKQMETEVRKIVSEGLLWGAAKLVPLAFGIHKLQISCVVEDDKVSIDWLTEEIEKNEDFVQSVDIAAFNKI